MLQYIVQNICAPCVEKVHESFESNTSALVIMDNFKGQITESVFSLLDQHNVHVRLLPPNTTDRLQPMDISVNKPVKDHLRSQFSEWHTEQILTQFRGSGTATDQPRNASHERTWCQVAGKSSTVHQ